MTTLINHMPDNTEQSVYVRVVKNPFDASNFVEDELVYQGVSLADYMVDLPNPDSWLIGYNGLSISREDWENITPKPRDVISLVRVPEGGDDSKEILRMVAMIAVAIAAPHLAAAFELSAAATFALTAAFAVGGALLVNAILPPIIPDLGLEDRDKVERSYGIDGPKNTARQGRPVPVVYGQYRVAGNITDIFTENINDDQFLHMRTVINDGEVEEVTDVEIDEQPFTNFKDVVIRRSMGTDDQPVNDWFDKSVRLSTRNQELDQSWVTYTTSAPVDKIRVDFNAPNGLVRYDDKGNEQTVTVTLQIEYREVGTSTWGPLPADGFEQINFGSYNSYDTPYAGYTDTRVQFTGENFATIPSRGGSTIGLDVRYAHTVNADGTYTPGGGVEYTPSGQGTWIPVNTANGGLVRYPQPDVQTGNRDPGVIEPITEDHVDIRTDHDGDIDVRTTGGASIQNISYYQYGGGYQYTMRGRSTRSQRKTVKSVQLPRAEYEVRVRRISAASSDAQTIDSVYVTDFGEVDIDPVRLAGTSTLSMRIRASDQLQRQPTLTSLVKGCILQEYDSGGNPTVKRWSANPAWIVADILTHPQRGAGIDPERIDWAAFNELARFCDDNGLEWNGVFEITSNIWDATQQVLRIARAQFIRLGTKWSLAIDKQADPEMLFADGNIIEGTFSTSWIGMEDRANEIQISFQDRDDGFKRKTVRMTDTSIGRTSTNRRVASYSQRGITSVSQAQAEAEMALRRNKLLRKMVTFDAPIESIGVTIGDVALVQNKSANYSNGFSGRLDTGSSVSSVVLDREVTLENGENYSILVHFPAIKRYDITVNSVSENGTRLNTSGLPASPKIINKVVQGGNEADIVDIVGDIIYIQGDNIGTGGVEVWGINVVEERDVTNGAGEHTVITVNTNFDEVPPQFANFAIGKTNTVKEPFRVTGISGSDPYVRTLSFVEYSEDMYLPLGTALPPPESIGVRKVDQVENLAIQFTKFNSGDVERLRVESTWDYTDRYNYGGADLYKRYGDGPWEHIKTVSDVRRADLEIEDGGILTIKVVAFDLNGRRARFGDAPVFESNTEIVMRPIKAPTNIRIDQTYYDVNGRVQLAWDAPIDEKVTNYRIDYKEIGQATYDDISLGNILEQPDANSTQGEIDAWNTGFISHSNVGDLSTFVSDLPAGYYQFRVRAERGRSFSTWLVLTYQLAAPGFVDTVAGLRTDDGGTTFNGRDCNIIWDSIFEQADTAGSGIDANGLPFVLRDYEVKIIDLFDNVLRTEHVREPYYRYTYEKNIDDSSGITDKARRSFKVSVSARGRQGQVSTAQTITVSNPAPALPTVSEEPRNGQVFLNVEESDDPDYRGVIIWASETSGFARSSATEYFRGAGMPVLQGDPGTRVYYRYAGYDGFGESNLIESDELYVDIPAALGGVDQETLNEIDFNAESIAREFLEQANWRQTSESLLFLDGKTVGTVITEEKIKNDDQATSLTLLGSRNGDDSAWIIDGDTVLVNDESGSSAKSIGLIRAEHDNNVSQVGINAGAIADVEGLLEAYWNVTVSIPGAEAFILANASNEYGGIPYSTVGIGADRFAIYNDTTSGWESVLRVEGGLVKISGDLEVGSSIVVGDARWPVALATVEYAVEDGESVIYGGDLGQVPVISFGISNLAPLSSGETYNVKVTNSTSTGFTMSAKIVTPGATGTITQTVSSSGGGGANPDWVMEKNDPADAYDGKYIFEISGNIEIVSHNEPEIGLYFNAGIVQINIMIDPGSGWEVVRTVTVNGSDIGIPNDSTTNRSGTYPFTKSFVVDYGDPIGQHGSPEFAVEDAYGGNTITSLDKVSWVAQAQSGTRTASPNGEKVIVTVTPRNIQ